MERVSALAARREESLFADEWHPADARITLERNGETAPFTITCGLAGWFVHTVFFSTEDEAQTTFKSMMADLDKIIALVPLRDSERRNPNGHDNTEQDETATAAASFHALCRSEKKPTK